LDFVIKSLAASLVMSLLLRILNPEGTVSLALAVVVSALVYFVVLFILKGFTFAEIDSIKKMLHN
jgi:hypothetical protein